MGLFVPAMLNTRLQNLVGCFQVVTEFIPNFVLNLKLPYSTIMIWRFLVVIYIRALLRMSCICIYVPVTAAITLGVTQRVNSLFSACIVLVSHQFVF